MPGQIGEHTGKRGVRLMSILNDMLNMGMMGEPGRVDYVIREYEKLEARLTRLEGLLLAKGLITNAEQSALQSPDSDGAVPVDEAK